VGSCAAIGTDKEINKAAQIATFLSMTKFSILSSMIVSFISIGERYAAANLSIQLLAAFGKEYRGRRRDGLIGALVLLCREAGDTQHN
jgi:hypothetical protein